MGRTRKRTIKSRVAPHFDYGAAEVCCILSVLAKLALYAAICTSVLRFLSSSSMWSLEHSSGMARPAGLVAHHHDRPYTMAVLPATSDKTLAHTGSMLTRAYPLNLHISSPHEHVNNTASPDKRASATEWSVIATTRFKPAKFEWIVGRYPSDQQWRLKHTK